MEFLICFVAVVLLLCIWYHIKFHEQITLAKQLPGPKPLPFVGNALIFRGKSERDLMTSLESLTKMYGKTTRILIGPHVLVLTTDPKDAEVILSSQKLNDKSDEYRYLVPWLGSGLLVGSGQTWFHRRKIITPTFDFKILEQFAEVFDKHGSILVDQLAKRCHTIIDVVPLVTSCALDIICESAMGVEIEAQINSESIYVKAVQEMTNIVANRKFNIFLRNEFLFGLSKLGKRQKEVLKILHNFTDAVIVARRKELLIKSKEKEIEAVDDIGAKKKLPFLDVMLSSTIHGQPLTNMDIREEVDTFMFGGHETMKTGISFCLYNLAKNPTAQAKAFEEAKDVFRDVDAKMTQKDLNQLHYLDLVIKESLRMYPPVPLFGRNATDNVEINGKIIPKGSNVGICPYLMGRDETLWEDPLKFIPERFEAGNTLINPYVHIPFSAGPRNCVGQKFAILEMKSLIAKTLLNFEIDLAPDFEVKVVLEINLKPLNGIQLIFKRRNLLA